MTRRTTSLGLTIALMLTCAPAQWLDYRDPKIPRTEDGRPNLAAPAPRLNGKPDLSGVWEAERTPLNEFTSVLGEGVHLVQVDINDVTKHTINVFWDTPPEDVPMRPEGAAVLEQRMKSGEQMHTTYCLPDSVPMAPPFLS